MCLVDAQMKCVCVGVSQLYLEPTVCPHYYAFGQYIDVSDSAHHLQESSDPAGVSNTPSQKSEDLKRLKLTLKVSDAELSNFKELILHFSSNRQMTGTPRPRVVPP